MAAIFARKALGGWKGRKRGHGSEVIAPRSWSWWQRPFMQDFSWNFEIKRIATCTEARLANLQRGELIVLGEDWCGDVVIGVVDTLIARAAGGRFIVVFFEVPQATFT
jgi:hypothetical protein